MDADAEFHDLGGIRVDAPRRALGLDKMFHRAKGWQRGVPSSPAPASPPQSTVSLALPLPSSSTASPLARLWEYPDLVPLVLEELDRPGHLAAAARVCSQWNSIVRKRLYADIWVRPWESAPKQKLVKLFTTLRSNPTLCSMVRSLDIRFFPLDMQGDMLVWLEDDVLDSLAMMQNLERLIWTRDRSISSTLFASIVSLPRLRYLEISGHSTNQYDPSLLSHMASLEDLRVMMPDATFRAALPDVIKALDQRRSGGLRGLALVCKSLNLINDALLRELAPHLTRLKRLSLIGAMRITKWGVYPLLEAAEGIEDLVLDASAYSDLLDLSDAPDCPSLHTFSISFPAPKGRETLEEGDMPRVRSSDLRALELNLSSSGPGGQRQRILSSAALGALTAQIDFTRLTRLALLNLVVDADVLNSVLANSSNLEELYITIWSHRTLASMPSTNLRIFHANAPEALAPTRDHLSVLARSMPRLEQIGSMNRIYEVHRRLTPVGGSTIDLVRWSRVYTPGYFLVWRP